jgi:hypothetical protein
MRELDGGPRDFKALQRINVERGVGGQGLVAASIAVANDAAYALSLVTKHTLQLWVAVQQPV